jgi:hypothetical protein
MTLQEKASRRKILTIQCNTRAAIPFTQPKQQEEITS